MSPAFTAASALHALAGGALIGLAAALVLVVHRRVAGISGILARALDADPGRGFRLAFLGGLIATGAAVALLSPGAIPGAIRGPATLAVAGLLVGVGTTLANGCTSGHGVCGLARGSRRSLAAVATFMATAFATATIAGLVRGW